MATPIDVSKAVSIHSLLRTIVGIPNVTRKPSNKIWDDGFLHRGMICRESPWAPVERCACVHVRMTGSVASLGRRLRHGLGQVRRWGRRRLDAIRGGGNLLSWTRQIRPKLDADPIPSYVSRRHLLSLHQDTVRTTLRFPTSTQPTSALRQSINGTPLESVPCWYSTWRLSKGPIVPLQTDREIHTDILPPTCFLRCCAQHFINKVTQSS